MIGLDEEGRRQLVVGMDEVAQGADEHPHGEGSIEAEGFITDKTHVGRLAVDHDLMLHEVHANELLAFGISLLNVLVSCLYVQGLLDDVFWCMVIVELCDCRLCRLLGSQLEEHIVKRDDFRL